MSTAPVPQIDRVWRRIPNHVRGRARVDTPVTHTLDCSWANMPNVVSVYVGLTVGDQGAGFIVNEGDDDAEVERKMTAVLAKQPA